MLLKLKVRATRKSHQLRGGANPIAINGKGNSRSVFSNLRNIAVQADKSIVLCNCNCNARHIDGGRCKRIKKNTQLGTFERRQVSQALDCTMSNRLWCVTGTECARDILTGDDSSSYLFASLLIRCPRIQRLFDVNSTYRILRPTTSFLNR